MRRLLVAICWVFAAGYALALGVWAMGTFGLFGQARDPLAGVLLIPLGWPWTLAAEPAPEPLRRWIGLLSPLINLAIWGGLARLAGQRRSSG